jgi:hypothetical protein
MAILEEEIREEHAAETEEELEEEAEVREAEGQQELVVAAFGAGLDHQTLMRYDVMAHHISHAVAGDKLAIAEHKVATQWDPLHELHKHSETSLRALQSIKGHVLAPMLLKKTKEAHRLLEDRATELMASSIVGQSKSRDDIREQFCGDISKEVTGAAYHPVAVEVYEQLIAPVSREVEPEPAVEPHQQEKAQEQIEEEEQQKESA